jgi:hypothetical protein
MDILFTLHHESWANDEGQKKKKKKKKKKRKKRLMGSGIRGISRADRTKLD